jgi:hypothetical protein
MDLTNTLRNSFHPNNRLQPALVAVHHHLLRRQVRRSKFRETQSLSVSRGIYARQTTVEMSSTTHENGSNDDGIDTNVNAVDEEPSDAEVEVQKLSPEEQRIALEAAQRLKNEGNEKYKSGEFEDAIDLYSKALDLTLPTDFAGS